jgi:hypothetical protein
VSVIFAAVTIIDSASARVTLSGMVAFTVSGNSSSTVTLLNRGENSHHARATAGTATAIANAIAVMVLRLRVDVAQRIICIAHPQATKTRSLNFSCLIRRYVSRNTQIG